MTGWETLPFAEVFDDLTGGNVKTLQSDYEPVGEFPIVDQGQSLIGGFTNKAERLCKAPLPVIVFGDHTKAIKYVDFPFCVGADGTKILCPKRHLKVDEKYLFYFLNTVYIPDAGYSRHFKYLKNVQVPLPPLAEQRRIAAILDKADGLRLLRQNLIDRTNELGKSVFYEMFGDPRFNERGYQVQELSSLGEVKLGKMLNKGKKRGDRNFPYLRNANVRWFHFDLQDVSEMDFYESEIDRFRVLPGDLLVCEGGEPGRCAIWDDPVNEIYYQKALHRVRLDSDLALPEYVQYWLYLAAKLGMLSESVSSATIAHLTADKIKKLRVIVPPVSDQERFKEVLGKVSSLSDRIAAAQSLQESLFRSLQNLAFRGEL